MRAIAPIFVAALAACCATGAGTTSGAAASGSSSGATTSSTTSSTTSGTSGSTPVTDAGCETCTLGGGGFGSGFGICLTACPGGSATHDGDPRCVFPGVPDAGCGYPSACGSSYACLDSDPSNCGFCGHACASGELCQGYYCGVMCYGDFVRTEIDPQNCGACEHACDAGEVCGNRLCGASCEPTPQACGGRGYPPLSDAGCTACPGCYDNHGDVACIDLTSDSNHCGSCGTSCLPGQICQNSTCTRPCAAGQVCAGSCQDSCPTGLSPCSGICTDLQNDSNNCGACGVQCDVCVAGSCDGSCPYYGPDAG